MVVASLFEDLLDQYKLEQRIAEKRYTDLYQAYDVDNDRPVWLDIVRDGYADDSAFTDRFVNRARALAQIRHPNIAPVFHIGKAAGGAPYVAQAPVDGYTLTYRLEQLARRETPVNPIYALKLVRQLVDALLLAERLEIFHYDLQPDNILLKNVTLPADDTVVLVDLHVPPDPTPRAGVEKEQPQGACLSPEQRGGKGITAAGHVYSLGAILHHLLAGKMPAHPVTIQGTALNRLFGRATALERERPGLTPATYQLVDRSLRKDPRGRYPTIEAFAAALKNALAAEELRLGAAIRPAPVARKPQIWLVPLLVLALFLVVGAMAMQNLGNGNAGVASLSTMAISPPTLLASGDAAKSSPTPPSSPESTAPPQPTSDAAAVAAEPSPTVPPTASPTELVAGQTPEPSPTSSPTAEPTTTPTAEPAMPRVRVVHNLVNLRRGPGVAYLLMGSVRGGEVLDVLAWNNDQLNPWYLVMTGDQRIGWIASTVVQAEDPDAMDDVPVAATLPPAPEPSATLESTPTVIAISTATATTDPGDLGGGGGSTPPPEQPTSPPVEPTSPPVDPTSTPVPIPTDPPSP